MGFKEEIRKQSSAACREICEKARLRKGQILVVGCSTSEICGSVIGSNSNPELAEEVFCGVYEVLKEKGIYLAAQCCEHLNRAIVIEQEAVPNAEIVNVVPKPTAGGSFAAVAFHHFKHPVTLEEVYADGGIDIGDTMIGMHLKRVAVPVRLENNRIGQDRVIAARVRPRFIGGERACYDEKLR